MKRLEKMGWIAAVCMGMVAFCTATALAADGTFERTLKLNGPVLLGIDTESGNIHVTPGPVSTMHIVGHVHSSKSFFGGDGDAEGRVRQVVSAPPINQAGNIISVGHNFHEKDISIDYDIVTPRGTDLRAESGSGDIKVEDEGGPVQLKTGSGNIDATGLSDHVSLETGSGNITAGMLSARDVKAETGSGNIALKNVQSGLWAHSGSGNVDVTGKPLAPWKLETGSGDIAAVTGGSPLTLNATTGNGNIVYESGSLKPSSSTSEQHVMGEANGGGPELRAMTGSGNIRIQ